MIWNYLKTTIRSLLKNRIYAIISLLGLMVGIAAFLLVFLFVNYELSHDSGFSETEKIYRVTEKVDLNGQIDHFAPTTVKIAPYLQENYPEIEVATRAMFGSIRTLRYEEQMINYENFYIADSNFFKVLDFEFLYGDPAVALSKPKSIVISEKVYHTFFGQEDPSGKVMEINGQKMTVSGVVKEGINPSHFKFDGFISFSTMDKRIVEQYESDWMRIACHTYVRTRHELDLAAFNSKLDTWAEETIDPWIRKHEVDGSARFFLQPIREIHFDLSKIYDHKSNTNKKYIYIFSFVSIFLILIAAINYINLATVRSVRRAREVGIRKVSGAGRAQLFRQFMIEAGIVTLIAALFSIILAELALPAFNNLTGLDLSLLQVFLSSNGVKLMLVLIGIWLLTAFISGFYPALVLSGYQPVEALKSGMSGKGVVRKGLSANALRKVLVGLQLVISTAMIFSTLVIYSQLRFMQKKDLGFEEENFLVVNESRYAKSAGNWEVLRQKLLQLPEVEEVSAASTYPGFQHGRLLFYVDNDGEAQQKTMALAMVDEHYPDMLQVEMAEGRFFSSEYPNDATESFVINEAAVKFLGLEKAVGTDMLCGMGVNGKIVGVIKDYNFESLHKKVEPMAMLYLPRYTYRIGIRLNESSPQVISKINDIWLQMNPDTPFVYTFLKDKLDAQYSRERNMLSIFVYFSLLILLIASLGLFAVAAYTAQQRARNNAIRKVLGATYWEIARQQLKEVLMLAGIAGVIATPLAWFFMSRWLEDFSYSIAINWMYFFFSILAAMMISVFTVMYIIRNSAMASPLNAIKYE